MTVAELIAALQSLQEQLGPDAEVVGQSHGCCRHGHDIRAVEPGGDYDPEGSIVIRV